MVKAEDLMEWIGWGGEKRKSNGLVGSKLDLLLVEMEGLEPSSKRGTNELSTCVVSTWLSGSDRQETANHNLSL